MSILSIQGENILNLSHFSRFCVIFLCSETCEEGQTKRRKAGVKTTTRTDDNNGEILGC